LFLILSSDEVQPLGMITSPAELIVNETSGALYAIAMRTLRRSRKDILHLKLLSYKHALEYKWTAEQLIKLIALVRNPEFDSKEVDPDRA
jgi:hypothetical protein